MLVLHPFFISRCASRAARRVRTNSSLFLRQFVDGCRWEGLKFKWMLPPFPTFSAFFRDLLKKFAASVPSIRAFWTLNGFRLLFVVFLQILRCVSILSALKFLLQTEHWVRPATGRNFSSRPTLLPRSAGFPSFFKWTLGLPVSFLEPSCFLLGGGRLSWLLFWCRPGGPQTADLPNSFSQVFLVWLIWLLPHSTLRLSRGRRSLGWKPPQLQMELFGFWTQKLWW